MPESCSCIRNTIFIHILYARAVWSVIAIFSGGKKREKKLSKAFWLTIKKKKLEPDKYFCFGEETIYQQQNKPESVQSCLLKTNRTIQSLETNSKLS